METLNYKVLEGTGYNGYILKDAPVKVMQFGEGNFLRAFVDYFYDVANEKAGYNGKVKLVQPIGNFPQMADWINEQEGLYTLYLRGSEKGQKVDAKRVISCVSDCVCPYIDNKWDEVLALARSERSGDCCIQHHRGRHCLHARATASSIRFPPTASLQS